VRIVVTTLTRELLSLLAFQNHSMTPEAIKARSNSFHHDVESVLMNSDVDVERFQIRFALDPVGVTCTLIDPQHTLIKKRRAIVLYVGFRVPYD